MNAELFKLLKSKINKEKKSISLANDQDCKDVKIYSENFEINLFGKDIDCTIKGLFEVIDSTVSWYEGDSECFADAYELDFRKLIVLDSDDNELFELDFEQQTEIAELLFNGYDIKSLDYDSDVFVHKVRI